MVSSEYTNSSWLAIQKDAISSEANIIHTLTLNPDPNPNPKPY